MMIMTSYTIRVEWYDEVKASGLVEMVDPYFYEENNREMVEVDVDEEQFIKVSRELGWMY